MATTKKSADRTRMSKKPAKSTKHSSKNVPKMTSFHLAKADQPFMTFKITVQTVYWLILSGVVLLLGIWMIIINQRVQAIYDQVELSYVTQSHDEEILQKLRQVAEKKE